MATNRISGARLSLGRGSGTKLHRERNRIGGWEIACAPAVIAGVLFFPPNTDET